MNTQSIRLFRNNFLESLTHVHPIVPLLFWSPVVVFLLWRALTVHDLSLLSVAVLLVPGLLVWTLTEYLLHRFVFHFSARSSAGKWLVHLFHGVHHDAPNDKTRLVMPPAGAVIVMAVLWALFSFLIPAPWAEPFCAFFIVGYLIYDYLHYATHHFRMRHPLLDALKHHHMQHHFTSKNTRYGVSSPVWDWVFGTLR
jgi:sterol desaturase/sphingolipid hydroxylase (fatty acid hydroxylase superfamily)